MTEKECTDYGKGISPLYAAENPATYIPKASVQFSVFVERPKVLKETQPQQKIEPRPVIIVQPKIEYREYKRLSIWRNLMVILQKWMPRIDSV